MQACFQPINRAQTRLSGPMGERLEANRRHWLFTAPAANPAMLEMFRD
jgi:hypothetical protein